MPTSTFTYNLDGAMTAAQGEPFSTIQRHKYTRLPIEIASVDSSMALRYDSFGRRLHKTGAQAIFYRSGAHHPASDRTKELEKGDEIHHTLIELVDGTEVVYLFTPAGQTILRRKHGYARIARDHLRSVRVEASVNVNITAHYSAFGKSIIMGGQLRRAFAGYEPDVETGLYNANRRLYAPTLRLFVSVGTQLQDASPYPYCGGDPFNNIDPTGEISAAVVNGVIAGLLLVVGVIAIIVSQGLAAGPVTAAIAADGSTEITDGLAVVVEEGTVADYVGSSEAVEESFSLSGFLAKHIPLKVGEYAKFGAGFGFASAVVSNGTQLATQASNGEHISAWQAVKSMLIAPVIAAVSGGIGGGIAGVGLGAAEGPLLFFGMSLLGAAAAGAIDSIANTAIDGQIDKRSDWESIGIQMAVAVGEALVMAPFFSRVPTVPEARTISLMDKHTISEIGGQKVLTRERVYQGIRRNLTQWERLKGTVRPHFYVEEIPAEQNGALLRRRLRFHVPNREYAAAFAPPIAFYPLFQPSG